jgi:uncharacterized membrane protein
MTTRRKFWTYLTTAFVAIAVVVGTTVADELMGYITKVDVEGKKLTVVDKDDKETEVTVTSDTEYVTPKGSSKIDLEKVAKNVTRQKDAGKKGIGVTVTHEKGTASKIEQKAGKKKAAAPSNN